MALATQTLATGAQSLGGGFTSVNGNWLWRGVRVGNTYRVTPLSPGGGTSNFALSYNGTSCDNGCDAWHNPAAHDFATPAGTWGLIVAGRNNGGSNLTFTDYTIQDQGSDEGVSTVQCKVGLATSSLSIATPTAGNLLVATVLVHEQGGVGTGTFPAIDVPTGWTACSAQWGHDIGGSTGVQMRTVYKAAAGSETSFTPTASSGSFASPDTVVVREYGGGLVGATLLGQVTDFGVGDDTFAGTTPGGSPVLAVSNMGWGAGIPRWDANTGPFVADLWTTANDTVRAACWRDVSPSGSFSYAIRPGGGGVVWAAEVDYFGAPGPSGPGPRSQSVIVG